LDSGGKREVSRPEDAIDWSLTTWEGSRRAALRDWMNLTLTQKWSAVEEMSELGRATIERRRKQGLPYIDPYTRELVPARVAEEPPSSSNPAQE
jgi:hypothetical protein